MTNPARKLPEITASPAGSPANDTGPRNAFGVPALPTDREITLAMLVALFTTPHAGCRAIHLRGYADEALHDEGRKVDTARILHAVPRVVVSAARTLAHLAPASARFIVFDPEILGVIVHEAAALADLHARFLAAKPGRSVRKARLDTAQQASHQAAIVERDLVRVGLRQVLGPSSHDDLAPAQDASDDVALASGIDHLADLIDRTLADGTDDERDQLTRRRLGADRAASLRAMASSLRGTQTASAAAPPPTAVTQRELDVQDGRVLVLLDALVAGMQQAHRANRAIELPAYGQLTKRYQSRSGSRKPREAAGAPRDGGAPDDAKPR